MSVQVSKNSSNRPAILDQSLAVSRDNAILLQDAGRAAPLVQYTLLAKVPASGKYVPFSDETAIDGTAFPDAIYLGPEVLAADLVAGDVEDVIILEGGDCVFDKEQLIIENGKLLSTIIGAGINQKTVERVLKEIGIFMGASDETTSFEN